MFFKQLTIHFSVQDTTKIHHKSQKGRLSEALAIFVLEGLQLHLFCQIHRVDHANLRATL